MTESPETRTPQTKPELNKVFPHFKGPITDYLKIELSELMEQIEELGTRMHNLNTNDAEYIGCYTTLAAVAPTAAQLWPTPTRLVSHQTQRTTSQTLSPYTERPCTLGCFICGNPYHRITSCKVAE